MKAQRKILAILAVVCSIGSLAFGQGTVSGTVIDKGNGDTIIGANVLLEGTDRVAFTDVNGSYIFNTIPSGTYKVTASMDGFTKVTVEDVQVTDFKNTTVDIELKIDAFQSEMVVTAELLEESEVGLLRHRQKSNAISDAISSEEITRSGGSNAADAMTKITGASVVGGKYVFIRGLGDRYTSTHLNGAELPTSDPDVKSFQADLFPSNILDSIVTLKSFTPDKPGNFSGGIVDIGTKNYPERFTLNLSYGTSYNSQTTNNGEFIDYQGSGSDWLGQDDGVRALPGMVNGGNINLPRIEDAERDEALARQLDQATRAFQPIMNFSERSAPLNQSFGFSIGDQKPIFGQRFGYLATLTYGRSYKYIDNLRSARWELNENVGQASTLNNLSDLSGRKGTDTANWGGLATVSYTMAQNHEVGLNFIYTQNGQSQSEYRSGSWDEQFNNLTNVTLESRVLKYTERNLTSYQLWGEHFFPTFLNMSLDWNLSTSKSIQDEPDTRIFTNHFSERIRNGEPFINYQITSSTYNNPARYWRELTEDSESFQFNASIPFETWSGLRAKAKFGAFFDSKDRDFNEVRFEYARVNQEEATTPFRYDGDATSFFGPDRIGIIGFDEASGTYIFGNVIQVSPDSRGGNYNGESEISAFYGMVEMPLTDQLRMITGLRVEQAEFDVFNDTDRGFLDDNDNLPSLHFIYQTGDRTNFRLSYGRTLARPNFREKAPYSSFDFLTDGIYAGNPDLKRTLIDNFDFRWETFPRAGEIMAASVFYKSFENPIEKAFNLRFASEFGERRFENVDTAEVYGLELEYRKRFDQYIVENGGSHIFSMSANVSLIESEVDIPEEELAFLLERDPDASGNRSLQGQSPFIVNVGVNYDNVNNGMTASLFYNVFGERLEEVGLGGAPNSLEQPRHMLDFTYSQPVWKDFTVKFVARNLLDSPIEIIQEFKGVDYLRSEYKTGTNLSLSVSYKP